MVDVQLEVVADVYGDHARACRNMCPLEREGGNLTQAAVLPEREYEQARHDRGSEDHTFAPAPRERIRENRTRPDQEVRRLHPRRRAEQEPRQRRVRETGSGSSDRTTKYAAASTSTIDG